MQEEEKESFFGESYAWKLECYDCITHNNALKIYMLMFIYIMMWKEIFYRLGRSIDLFSKFKSQNLPPYFILKNIGVSTWTEIQNKSEAWWKV